VAPVTTKLRAVSIIRPPGVAGAIIGGLFHDNVQPKFRAALFADRAEGFAWLGRADSADEYARLDELMKLRGAPPPLRALRDHLAHDPVGATLAGAARTLALSERSLSRRLSELGTSFRNEVQRARLRIAEGLLVDTDLKLDAVAARSASPRARTSATSFTAPPARRRAIFARVAASRARETRTTAVLHGSVKVEDRAGYRSSILHHRASGRAPQKRAMRSRRLNRHACLSSKDPGRTERAHLRGRSSS